VDASSDTFHSAPHIKSRVEMESRLSATSAILLWQKLVPFVYRAKKHSLYTQASQIRFGLQSVKKTNISIMRIILFYVTIV